MQNLLLAMGAGSIIDIVIIIVLIVLAMLGMIKGFSQMIIKFVGGILSIVLAFALAGKCVVFLDKMFNLTNVLADGVSGWLKSIFSEELLDMTLSEFQTAYNNGLSFSAPKFILKILLGVASGAVPETTTVAQTLAPVFAYYVSLVIGFVFCYVLLKIIFFILARMMEKVVKAPLIGTVDKVLGAVLGALQGFISVYLILAVINILPFPFLNGLKDLLLTSGVATFVSNTNIFGLIFSGQNVIDYIKGFIS